MEIWIMGGGRFGRLALARLSARHPEALFTVVDLREPRDLPRGVRAVRGDAARFVFENLNERVRWIVPAVPFHLAFEWLLMRLGAGASRVPVPEEVAATLSEAGVPSVYRSKDGSLALSMAAFLCPDDCTEPRDFCPATGEKRARSLFSILEDMDTPAWPLEVLRSRQLGPGVGGFGPRDLLRLEHAIMERKTGLWATACRCHGVISGFEKLPIP